MRTTVAINQKVARRVFDHAEKIGNRSMAAMVEFMLRKSCDFIDSKGYDAFVKIPSNPDGAPCHTKIISK